MKSSIFPISFDPESILRWAYIWRRLHAIQEMRRRELGQEYSEVEHIDAGYCLDRYSIEHEVRGLVRVTP